jgi:hypothetical protein
MSLAQWTEVAWLKLGELDMKAGAHTLDIRLTPTKMKKAKLSASSMRVMPLWFRR